MNKQKLILLITLCAALLFAVACHSASAKNSAVHRFDAPAGRLQSLQEIVKTAQTIQAETKSKRETLINSLSLEQKKIIEDYTAKLTEIEKASQGQINGLQLLLNSHANELKLQFSKEGKIPLTEIDKFNLQQKSDGGWELADAPPLPATPTPAAQK